MASSSKPERIYHVFLSFRGEDVRNNFLGHLYTALDREGIYTYVDNEELRKGEQIAPALMKAIEESHIAIIVFSEDYASSWWCLEEVAKIMDCKEERDLIVFPVFYKVEPREVRTPRQKYREAMLKHESKFGKDSKEVKRWKKALSDAGSLFGWDLKDGDESKLIQRIVTKISTHLDRTPLHVAPHPVGIDSQVVKLKSMLKLESDNVLMVGLWGQGGIGKTTLAKAVYNDIFRQFGNSCFLANVREVSKDCKDLVTLQETLLSQTLALKERLEVFSVDRGMKIIQGRLCCKKVLLILDDVDDFRQLNALAGDDKWFGNGSRIIITTRDKHLLTRRGINQDHVYDVQALDDSKAHELFCKHAFLTHQKLEIRTDLVKSVLKLAEGLPLALEVLGSFLYGRREDEWKSALNKISTAPNKDINNVLKISYDGLDQNEREIFLHIACFFKGRSSDYVKEVLDSCNLEATIGFKILIERSLIRIGYSIEMHDLIQSMGMDIVNQECQDDPRKCSRLWLYDDVLDVLQHNKGDCAVKAIVLEPLEQKELSIHPNAFANMKGLRLLIMRNVHISFQGPICIPNELRWIECAGCGPWIPEFPPGPKKLVGLNMSKGSITGIVKQLKDFQQLQYIKLSDCQSLICTPNLSCTPNLEELHLSNCKSLVKVHESIADHDKLRVLKFKTCPELSVFPDELRSKNLEDLYIADCRKFRRFPNIPHKLEGLKRLSLIQVAIEKLPASIENLVSLQTMNLEACRNLVSLPSNIYKLQNVIKLVINSCPIEFPKYEDSIGMTGLLNLDYLSLGGCKLSEVDFLGNLSCFPSLSSLDLAFSGIASLPATINGRDCLTNLNVAFCEKLQEIPELPPFLHTLKAACCKSLQTNGHLTSIDDWVRRWLTIVDSPSLYEKMSRYFGFPSIEFSGREMPEWIHPVETDSVSFMASKDLYDKFLGVVLCAFSGEHERDGPLGISMIGQFNGETRSRPTDFGAFFLPCERSRIYIAYSMRDDVWGEVDFGQIDGRYAQFDFTKSFGSIRKWGVRIICKQLKDDLKIEIQENQLIDPAFLYEVDYESADLEIESSPTDSSSEADLHEDLQDCQRSAEEQSEIVPKGNHEVFSLEACEARPCGLLIRLAEMSMAAFARCFCC